jgi:hypothetical protein
MAPPKSVTRSRNASIDTSAIMQFAMVCPSGTSAVSSFIKAATGHS